jgi:hypothetical protein
MGNKSFDKVKYKTLLTEAASRMTIRRGKKVNQLHKEKKKIAEFVTNGDVNSALIYIDGYINEENKLKVFYVLSTMCEQMKGRIAEVETYGVTDDLSANANALVYASHRLDIKELEQLSVILKELMPKVEYKEAMNGTCINDIVRENISYKKIEKGESYLKLIEICNETGTQLILKEDWKKVLREYCYRNELEYPYSAEEDLGYNPGGDPVPVPAPYYSAAGPGPYGPPPSGYMPAPTYFLPPGSGMAIIPPPTYATPAADFGTDAKPKDIGFKPADPSPKPFSPSGYSLPPPPGELNLPKYGVESKKPDLEKPEKPSSKKKDDSDDESDDEDLMARLRNLQK